MCHPSKNLHGKKSKAKQQKQAKIKKSKAKQAEKPCEAQLFFLQNEDVLY